MSTPTLTETIRDGRNDFDFFMGTWTGRQRRLRERLAGCQEWEEFASETVARKILNGLGNIDEVTMHRATGDILGFTVRVFEPTTRQWRIYWADSVNGSAMEPPVVGSFKDGRGEFYAHEIIGGQSVFVRFLWTASSATQCRWEQAFSPDGGATWETNWIADFTRQA